MTVGGILTFIFLSVVSLGALVLYLKSFYKVIRVFKGEVQFSFWTVIRVVGIFMPAIGVTMGFKNGD